MIECLTDEFLKYRSPEKSIEIDLQPEKISEINQIEEKRNIVQIIEEKISKSYQNIEKMRILQNKQSLPSFVGRKEKTSSLNSLRIELELLLKEIKHLINIIDHKTRMKMCKTSTNKNIKNISECCVLFNGSCNKVYLEAEVEKNISKYLMRKYQKLIIKYREIEQKYLMKVRDIAIFDEIEQSMTLNQSNDSAKLSKLDLQLEESPEKIKMQSIQSKIFELTSMLHEVKLNLLSQDDELDRIDVSLRKVNKNLTKANKEVYKYRKRNKDFKDRVIMFMIFVCFGLFACIVFKYESGNILWLARGSNRNNNAALENYGISIKQKALIKQNWQNQKVIERHEPIPEPVPAPNTAE